ncbi:MAG: hypothetical protein JWM02_1819 [Frankiales bacterium]|nr:hypothetical protein [Frankiales bacterium]
MKVLEICPRPTLSAMARGVVPLLPFPLAEPGSVLYARARQALRSGAAALGLQPGDEVLMPAYHHGSEVEAWMRAGLRCRFFEPAPDLQPRERDLEQLMSASVRVLHLTHYLGFPQDARRWRAWCDEHALLLVEDAAQAWLSERDGRPVGAVGDLSVFCLYKSFGLPDGAAAVAHVPLAGPTTAGSSGVRATVPQAIRRGVSRHFASRASAVLEAEYDPELDFQVQSLDAAPSLVTCRLLPHLVFHHAAATRRRHYLQLLSAVSHLVPQPFTRLPDGAAPFLLPIAVDDRVNALGVLGRSGIRAIPLWSTPHPASRPQPGSRSNWLRAHVVGLPVHQGLTPDDVRRIAIASAVLRPAPGGPP